MNISENIRLDFHHDVEAKKTSCVITKDGLQFIGIAKCNPKDSFARPIGRKLSLTRVLTKKLNGERILNKEERKRVWSTLIERGVNLSF